MPQISNLDDGSLNYVMSNLKAHQQIKFELKIDGIGGAILKIEFEPSFFL